MRLRTRAAEPRLAAHAGPNALLDNRSPSQLWHTRSAAEAMEILETNPEGLTEAAAAARRARVGPNVLPEARRPGPVQLFLRQFKNPLVYVLLIAALISLTLGEWRDASFIMAVLLLNASIGTTQEWRAESSAAALQSVVQPTAIVIRDGHRQEISAADLVPGDIVLLESGQAVPADLRLIEAVDLRIDESLLTGESMPVEKAVEAVPDPLTPVGDRNNMVFAGTTVLAGRGTGVVCETGTSTEIGRIASALARPQTATPLVVRLEAFTHKIAIVILLLVVVVAIGEGLRGTGLGEIFFLAVALAVSAIPEGLPVAVTVALSLAATRMARRNVIVRLLPAVEGLGACTVIASDKTGTLTANRLTVERLLLPDGRLVDLGDAAAAARLEPARRLAVTGALANEAEIHRVGETVHTVGDTVDVAFLEMAEALGVRRDEQRRDRPLLGLIPYESERRFGAAFYGEGTRTVVHVKGAPEVVLSMCADVGPDTLAFVHQLAEQGLRVLALAAGEVSPSAAAAGESDALRGLTFLGFAGLGDPLREGVIGAVERCRRAGVEVRMVTGDHPATALAIARQLGIAAAPAEVATGRELAERADEPEALRRIMLAARVFARVEPAQKTLIVEALQAAGHFVAVTGDGVNDAPALRAAHIGVAMGVAGTDVARAAADLIIADDNFASIVNGIEEGRVAYDNIRKVVWLLISTGAAEIVIFLLTFAANLPLPLSPVQLLWLNLVTNGLQDVAMAFERAEAGVMDRPPRRPEEPIFDRLMIEETVLTGAWMGGVAFAVFAFLLQSGMDEFTARNLLLLLMVLFENVHAFTCRSERQSAMRIPLRNNPFLVAAVIGAQGLHIATMHLPGLRDILKVAPIRLAEWLVLLGIAASILLVAEAYKYWRHRREATGGLAT